MVLTVIFSAITSSLIVNADELDGYTKVDWSWNRDMETTDVNSVIVGGNIPFWRYVNKTSPANNNAIWKSIYGDELSDDEKNALLEQVDKTDMEVLSAIEHKSELVKKGEITPLDAMEHDEIKANYDTFKNTGVEAIKAGKVGAILLAGGMGTRLGSDNPKGMLYI